MPQRDSFVLVSLAGAALTVSATLFACSSSSGGGAPLGDGGGDAVADASGATDGSPDGTQGADSATDASADADAGPCSNVQVPDGDVYGMCLVARCCPEYSRCNQACTTYETCVIACAQMDAGQACFDQCGNANASGRALFQALEICGQQKCSAPPSDH